MAKESISSRAVLAAARAVSISFEGLPEEPIGIAECATTGTEVVRLIVERYHNHGFAVVHLSAGEVNVCGLTRVGDILNLGSPFVPPLYRKGAYTSQEISRLSVRSRNLSAHPSFERRDVLKLHCDGTLQPIGYVKTSILLCAQTAFEGGETVLFNAAAAFSLLVKTDRAAAAALTYPGVLIRQANMNGSSEINSGPVFTVRKGQLACCYSVSDTDSWGSPIGVNTDDVRRGVEYLAELTQPGSPFVCEFMLREGEAIIMNNTKISHGRKGYRDSDSQVRCLYRGLYLKEPSSETE